MSAGQAAHAAESFWPTKSCTKGGFTGYVRVAHVGTMVTAVQYKIFKGSNSGGNNANVDWVDGGIAPSKHFSTDSGIQDNAWHTLSNVDYYRGSGGTSMKFVFDKSGATDPSCTITSVL
ncbi:hypothetical protein GCM10009798_19190 [Nocardioides panacihumi]|uniref:Secreted protein n=1 Tax=Nocardioides panacihumi TaxID=400774 RepID=A0ABP5CAT8_9ACTN